MKKIKINIDLEIPFEKEWYPKEKFSTDEDILKYEKENIDLVDYVHRMKIIDIKIKD